jgi:uncharacterized protein YjiS (DUF1127 family)
MKKIIKWWNERKLSYINLKELDRLSNSQLKDIGIERHQIHRLTREAIIGYRNV